eukprot:gene27981-33789_t
MQKSVGIALLYILFSLLCALSYAVTYRKYNGHYYYIETGAQTSWNSARTTAISKGGYLVRISDAGENAFVQSIALAAGTSPWVGMQRCSSNNNQFCFADTNTVLTYTNWYDGEPSNPAELCVRLYHYADGTWNDQFCNLVYAYIVEFDSQPADASGLEIDEYSPPPSSDYRKFRGHYYYLSATLSTYETARSAAISMGGYLVKITDDDENSFVHSMALNAGLSPWLGIRLCSDLSRFCYVDTNTEVTFTRWSIHQPDGGSSEPCVKMFHNMKGLWNDHDCNRNFGYVVEFDSKPAAATGQEPDESEIQPTAQPSFSPVETIGQRDYVEYNGHYYYYSNTPKSFDQANRQAQKEGGHLVYIDDAAEYAVVQSMLKDSPVRIGVVSCPGDILSYCYSNDAFYISYSNWGANQPSREDMYESSYSVVIMYPVNKWFVQLNSFEYPFIVEYDTVPSASLGQEDSSSSSATVDVTVVIIVVVVVVGVVALVFAYCFFAKTASPADPFTAPPPNVPSMATATVASSDLPVLVCAEMVEMLGDSNLEQGNKPVTPSAPDMPTAATNKYYSSPSPNLFNPNSSLFSSQPNFFAPASLFMAPSSSAATPYTILPQSAPTPSSNGQTMVFPVAVIGSSNNGAIVTHGQHNVQNL